MSVTDYNARNLLAYIALAMGGSLASVTNQAYYNSVYQLVSEVVSGCLSHRALNLMPSQGPPLPRLGKSSGLQFKSKYVVRYGKTIAKNVTA